MPKGIYAAASAMYTEQRMVEVRAENMANAATPGYRRSEPLRDAFQELLAQRSNRTGPIDGNGGAGVYFADAYKVFAPGELFETGHNLDVALTGDAFFMLGGEDGQPLLTRAGHFTVDDQGLVRTDEGFVALGQGAELTIPDGAAEVQIDGLGNVTAMMRGDEGPEEVLLDRLRIVRVDDPSQMKARSGQFFEPAGQEFRDALPAEYTVHSGMLENANVSAVEEMVGMMTAQRRFDAAQRALTTQLNLGGNYSDILSRT